MKYILIILGLIGVVFFQVARAESCSSKTSSSSQEMERVVDTPVRKALKGATIVVVTRDGKEYQMSAEDYMVVPRKQKTTVKRVTETETLTCKNENKNLFMVGARKDHTGLSKEQGASSARVNSEQGPVLDASYMRQDVLGPIGVGAGIDTNGKPRVFFGVGF